MFVPPTVTDLDIAWVCRVLGLPSNAFSGADGEDPRLGVLKRMDSIDVEACPGSGKTTLLVAKLAILARRWSVAGAGMCVLSHTNAARDEIARKLSSCAEGATLMGYPHFVGTIHRFANEFLALPYLRSKGNPIKIIDSDVAIERRWAKVPHKTKLYLSRKNGGDGRPFMRYDSENYSSSKMATLGIHTATYAMVRDICQASSEDGYLCYDELLVWARKLTAEQPDISRDLRQRFPIVFIDEVQDNDEEQSALLHRVFIDGKTPSLRQRFGDSNQAIYQSSSVTSGAVTDAFPGPLRVDLPNSFRFGPVIAALADPFGVAPQGLVGLGPTKEAAGGKQKPPAIFLFDDASVRSVLPEYGKYLTEHFSPEELRVGLFTAVAGVHKGQEDDKVPRWIGHYVPTYNPKITHREPVPEFFSQYIVAGWRESERLLRTAPLVQATALAMLELLRLSDHENADARSRNPHKVVLALTTDAKALQRYLKLVDFFIRRAGGVTAEHWNGKVAKAIIEIAGNFLGAPVANPRATAFVSWKGTTDEEATTSISALSNVYQYPSDVPQLAIKLGSIHSVKGETHWSTLVLESYYRTHYLSTLKPWLLGERSGGITEKVLKQRGLRLHYVAMTRPSHLICVAMRADAINAGDRVTLQNRGWVLRDCPVHS